MMRSSEMTLRSKTVDVVNGISSMAMRDVLAELADAYAQRSRQRVAIVSVGGVDAARCISEGEAFDFVVLAADAIEQLAANGRVHLATQRHLARSNVAVAVPAGATPPDISSEAAVRDTVLRARSIGYSTGPSGAHLARLFDRWGTVDEIATRIVKAPPGVPVATLIARGDVEIGFQQLSELMNVPGVDVVGLLPSDIEAVTLFSAAVCTASQYPEAAEALLCYLASPQADAAKRRHGMEPA